MSEAFDGMMVTPSVKLVRQLGEGGMGSVWVAEHLALRTQVVVKFIASGLENNKEAQDRFSREAAAAAQVKSPHVVQTFDHGITEAGVPYIVMELLEGRDLGVYLGHEGRLPPALVVEIVTQLARALDRAHERGIVHRDIKPGNIYLCDVGRDGEVFVKLLDFGIAKGVEILRADSATKTGSMIGSPFYMSPEQILGSKDIDHRSDLWSVGVVCFEMLTGSKPFDAETMGGLAIRIHSEPLPVASVVNPALPATVDAWFERACAKDVRARFGSAKEMAEELARALGGQTPRVLDAAPRLSARPSGSKVDPVGATLVAGAATYAGVVRPTTQSRSRSRMLGVLAAVLLVPVVGYTVLRVLSSKGTPTALVTPDPSASVGLASATPGPASASSVPSALAPVIASSPAASSPAAPVASVDAPARAPASKPSPVGARGRPSSSARALASTPLPPSPAVTSNTTARPATSGHDIF